MRNELPHDMAIYVVRAGGGSSRLGTVMASSTGDVRIPHDVLSRLGDVQLVARPLGPGTALNLACGSLVPTSTVELVLGRAPAFSNCWVR